MTDAQTLNMLLGGTVKKARKPAAPRKRLAVGMDVTCFGKPARIVGKEGRMWQVEPIGEAWGANAGRVFTDNGDVIFPA